MGAEVLQSLCVASFMPHNEVKVIELQDPLQGLPIVLEGQLCRILLLKDKHLGLLDLQAPAETEAFESLPKPLQALC